MKLAAIYRHPVKSLGMERLTETVLEPGRRLAWDRVWAVAHPGGAFDSGAPEWRPCGEFLRQTHVPEFARIAARLDVATGTLTLTHPDRPDLVTSPDSPVGAKALEAWVAPLAEPRRDGPFRLCRLPKGGFTDAEEPWVSIASTRSLKVLEQRARADLGHVRFRANLWIDGLAPWEEFDLVGREIAIGPARIRITEPIERCRATEAGPESGTHDVPVLRHLREATGDINFAVYGEVTAGGRIAEGDPVAT